LLKVALNKKKQRWRIYQLIGLLKSQILHPIVKTTSVIWSNQLKQLWFL
jgi:hypothetical protein